MISWKRTKYSSLENSKEKKTPQKNRKKANLYLMELKAQTEILEDKTIH